MVMEVSLLQFYRSPFRDDSAGDAYFEWYNGKLQFIDFGNTARTHSDCFNAIQFKYGLSFKQALLHINNHFHLGLGSDNSAIPVIPIVIEHIPTVKETTTIIFHSRPFSHADARYWRQYQITRKQLIDDSVVPVLWYKFYSMRREKVITVRPKTVAYAYTDFDFGKVKIYVPHSVNRRSKWITNCSQEDIGNIDSLPLHGENLIITKSYKDCRILRNHAAKSIWFQNEGAIPNDEILKRLCRRFNRIHILFDNDATGKDASLKLLMSFNRLCGQNKVSRVFFPQQHNDAGEFIKVHSSSDLLKFLLENKMI